MKKFVNIVDVLMLDNVTNNIVDNIFLSMSKRLRGRNRSVIEKCLGTVPEVSNMACYSALLMLGYDIKSAYKFLNLKERGK